MKEKESKVNNLNFVMISGWMIRDLNLKGNALVIYAIIYGFSQAENQVFNGSLQYLADWTNGSKQGVQKNLKTLLDKGLIKKNENVINGVKFVEYYATKLMGIQQSCMGYATELHGGIQQSCMGGMQLSCTNNIDIDNIEDNKEEKIVKGKFIPPSLEQVKAYCLERKNSVDAERFIDYYASRGWMIGKNHMKDWKAAIRTWERNGYSNNSQGNNTQVSKPDILDEILR